MNFILICCDALRGDVGKAAGMPFDVCPTVDGLGARGTRFHHAYCTSPLCVPSRISMITGRWPDAHRVRMNLDAQDAVFSRDIYQVARDAGYFTGLSGKNHTYLTAHDVDFWREFSHEGGYRSPDAAPDVAAFDAWLKTLNMGVAQEATPFPLEAQLSYRIVSEAIAFLRQANSRPFFLQVSFPEPHGPSQVPKPYWNMFAPAEMPEPHPGPEAIPKLGYRMQWLSRLEEDGTPGMRDDWRRYLSNYFGAVRMVDDQIARLLNALENLGLHKETVIVFVADHGDYLMQYGLGRKGVGLSEALTHIPMVWSGADLPASQPDTHSFVSMADLMPTFCDAMQQPIPPGVQGNSLWRLLHGEPQMRSDFESAYVSVGLGGLFYDAADHVPLAIAEGPHNHHLWDTLNEVTQSGCEKMVRKGDWKLIYDMMGYGQLYDLSTDPGEINNLFGQPGTQALQVKLMEEMTRWLLRSESAITASSLRHKV
jgi:arylsulfatase A-like enzyme